MSTLRSSLDALVRLLERVSPGMRGSVLLLDEDGITLRHGAAPHLPVAYSQAIDGAHIGPAAGSCGTAAYRRERVIVRDATVDPLWADYRGLAEEHGVVACWSTPILNEDGTVLGTFAMYYDEPRDPTPTDIDLTETATLLAGNVIKRARAEDALGVALDETKRANKAKADFLAMMSHELRTPLNAIGGYAQLMLDGIPTPASEGQLNYLRRIAKSQQHLLGLIEAVLLHAKVEAGKVTYHIDEFRAREVLDVVDSLTAPQRAAKRLAYECDGCDPKLAFHADKQKVVQILLNILSNATKFTPPEGRITVETSVLGRDVGAFSVRDTGVGMSPKELELVFEPYVQFDNPLAREHKGTGLGMPISRELARGMGGDLTASSDPGVGSVFTLSLPLATITEPNDPR